jgi:hypothetical protein
MGPAATSLTGAERSFLRGQTEDEEKRRGYRRKVALSTFADHRRPSRDPYADSRPGVTDESIQPGTATDALDGVDASDLSQEGSGGVLAADAVPVGDD